MIIKIELTKEEAEKVFSVLDIACKAGGLSAAVVSTMLHDKIQAGALAAEREMAAGLEGFNFGDSDG